MAEKKMETRSKDLKCCSTILIISRLVIEIPLIIEIPYFYYPFVIRSDFVRNTGTTTSTTSTITNL